MIQIVLKDSAGKSLYTVTAPARTFSTGKTGFGAYGKVDAGAERFQLSFNLVKIVPKIAAK
jgi:hypothetical protein